MTRLFRGWNVLDIGLNTVYSTSMTEYGWNQDRSVYSCQDGLDISICKYNYIHFTNDPGDPSANVIFK